MYKNSICYSIKTALAGIGFLLMTSITDAQPQKTSDEIKQQIEKVRRSTDSLAQQSERMIKDMTDSINKASIVRSTERSYEWLNQYQAEKKRKEKKKAMMYIFFGVAGFAVLAYGLSRKRKKVS